MSVWSFVYLFTSVAGAKQKKKKEKDDFKIEDMTPTEASPTDTGEEKVVKNPPPPPPLPGKFALLFFTVVPEQFCLLVTGSHNFA